MQFKTSKNALYLMKIFSRRSLRIPCTPEMSKGKENAKGRNYWECKKGELIRAKKIILKQKCAFLEVDEERVGQTSHKNLP